MPNRGGEYRRRSRFKKPRRSNPSPRGPGGGGRSLRTVPPSSTGLLEGHADKPEFTGAMIAGKDAERHYVDASKYFIFRVRDVKYCVAVNSQTMLVALINQVLREQLGDRVEARITSRNRRILLRVPQELRRHLSLNQEVLGNFARLRVEMTG